VFSRPADVQTKPLKGLKGNSFGVHRFLHAQL
jgi:hypothetical protein